MEEVVLRVNQLDACELDESLADALQHQLITVLRPLQSTSLLKWLPELKTLLKLLVWKCSLYDNHFSLGQDMLHVKYGSSSAPSSSLTTFQKGGLFFATVLADWMLERLDLLSIHGTNPSHIQQSLSWLTTLFKSLSLINFALFLIQGRYPTLKERILGLYMHPTIPQTILSISHNYMTREMLWHGFSEFIFVVLPEINVFSLRNYLRRFFGVKFSTNTSNCTFCEATPTMPHIANCGDVYCYYCLKANLIADTNFPCIACNEIVHTCTPISEIMRQV